MKIQQLLGVILLTIFVSLAMSTSAWAKKGGNGQTGNGGGGGGNDSPDPEYTIHASMVAETCLAYNPDLKGPGIAFGGFYDHIDVAPVTCALVGSGSDSFYIRTLGVRANENNVLTHVWLTGRDLNGYLYDSEETSIPVQDPEAVDLEAVTFTVNVDRSIKMTKCKKVRGNNECSMAGSIYIENLMYVKIGN